MSREPNPAGPRTNALAGQTSPYLLQHQHNPVNWMPWGPEALDRARREDKPIFLSIGYAACHWCHVMERESFENDAIAEFLNEHFVSIKVDREERPDLDEIYMGAVQAITGRGGWPLSVFLTPDLEPFYGGTYFPPEDRHGMPGFLTVLRHVASAWRDRRGDVAASAASLTSHLREMTRPIPADADAVPPSRAEIAAAAAELSARFDAAWGGFGGPPKFPPHGAVALLLRERARGGNEAPLRMARTTLDRMACGGIYDHVGGGFARYSVDERWLVPHFEKMLYDQALLVPVYVDAWLETGRPLYRRVVEETLDFVRRELTDAAGGFWSSLDADSDGHEGAFYVWTPEEVERVLGADDGRWFCGLYGITAEGNFEGKSIANLLGGSLEERASRSGIDEEALVARISPLRARLLEAREGRSRPATDDKVLAAWNGLMITAFARAYQALGRPQDLLSAQRAAAFARRELMGRDGRLLAVWRRGEGRLNAYLDDHVFLARGFLDLYESDFDVSHLDEASRLMTIVLDRFRDGAGGFHFTSDDHETLLTRTRSVWDDALPAGSGVAVEVLSRLAAHRDEPRFEEAAEATLRSLGPTVRRAPSAFAALLAAVDFRDGPTPEIAVVGEPGDPRTAALLAAARRVYVPSRAIAAGRPGSDEPLLRGKTLKGGAPTAYVCRDRACDAPVNDARALRSQIEKLRGR